jgi:hypothetical protein
METVLFAMANNPDRFYSILSATFIVGGFVALYFASECLQKNILQTWISLMFLGIVGLTMLYYGFSSLLDLSNGNHRTLDAFLGNIEIVTKFLT